MGVAWHYLSFGQVDGQAMGVDGGEVVVMRAERMMGNDGYMQLHSHMPVSTT